jgi:hypothetical protein
MAWFGDHGDGLSAILVDGRRDIRIRVYRVVHRLESAGAYWDVGGVQSYFDCGAALTVNSASCDGILSS